MVVLIEVDVLEVVDLVVETVMHQVETVALEVLMTEAATEIEEETVRVLDQDLKEAEVIEVKEVQVKEEVEVSEGHLLHLEVNNN